MFRLFILLLVTFLTSTSSVYAYAVLGTGTAQISERHTLFLITYGFGHDTYSFSLPTTAVRGSKPSPNVLSYSIRTPEGLTVKDGRAVAGIWSTAPKQEQQFKTTTGTSTTFTLAVLYEKAATSSRANTLTVDHLPFVIGNTPGALATHELRAYTVSASGTKALNTQE